MGEDVEAAKPSWNLHAYHGFKRGPLPGCNAMYGDIPCSGTIEQHCQCGHSDHQPQPAGPPTMLPAEPTSQPEGPYANEHGDDFDHEPHCPCRPDHTCCLCNRWQAIQEYRHESGRAR